ncbi:cupin domain-containing protein [Hymenobacter lucidus]|uniref:Cupin domain-containing protein n=1 Tax=Hymenobacter lucidus TaxID=2880930 RepID=A0ABS8AP02_9BACT|nr:cupin domain-containing protein [Hymenobacter lucidus]MCB2407918.1 cupin domain-containing protein [Hymenobacter lucidus]
MQRRAFLHLPLLAPAAYALPWWAGPLEPAAADELTGKAVLVRSKQDRSNKPFRFLDATFTVKVSGQDTGGRCVIFDTLRHEKVGPFLHFHKNCEEWFYVVEGEFKFQAGEEMMRLQAGDSLLVPRGMQHAFVKTSEGTARLIVMHQPAGTLEEYFRTSGELPMDTRKALGVKHDIHYTGPPLKPD